MPLGAILELVGLSATVAAAVALGYERIMHLHHLHQAEQDHRRLYRLSVRLAGCVVDLERMLEVGVPVPAPGVLPDDVAGHMTYLFGLRDECDLFRSRAASHNARLSWPQAFADRVTVTSRRCTGAHAALSAAADELAQAARVYEEGFVVAYVKRAGAGADRAPGDPLLMLSKKRASRIVANRTAFETQMRLAATHLRLGPPLTEHYRCTWPAMTSERASFPADPYRGEVRPMGRHGFGAVPVLHPDGR